MGDKTSSHNSKAFTSSPLPEENNFRKIEWKQISKGELPPSDRQVIAVIDYGMGVIQYQACYGIELLVGRKQDKYCGAKHERDWWTVIPPPPGHRFSGRLKRIINIENRFEDEE